MRILAVDDERLALENLIETIVSACPDAEVKGFRYPEDAIEYARNNVCDVAFLDIEMGKINGVGLAEKLKELNPDVNIIFATGYGNYRDVAFDMHASGYIEKPVTAQKVAHELANLRRPVPSLKRVRVQAFGNFEVYLDGEPMNFRYSKTRELLAYLVDRKGAMCTVGEMCAALFEDSDHVVYFKSIRGDLLTTLKSHGCEGIVVHQYGMLGVVPSEVDCDYYDFLNGKVTAANAYRGEYMTQYSWAESTHAALEKTF